MKEKILRGFKYELLPSKELKVFYAQTSGSCRYIWNSFLDLKKNKWEKNREKISRFELDKLLTDLKKEKEWLSSVPSQALQQVNKDLDQAFKNFFKGSGYPNFKKKGINDSFRLPQGITLEKSLSKRIGQVKLPKFGIVRFIKTREIEGVIKNATISRKCGKWFISFNCEIEKEIKEKKDGKITGIDRGIKIFAACSDKTKIEGISPLKKNLDKLKKLQRKLKRKKKFSSNWGKIIRKIRKAHHHIKNKRKDYLHKITNQLSKNQRLIFLENLKVGNMSRSAKGSLENPGKNVKAKSGLNRSILDQGWHMFQVFLEYKMRLNGGKIIYVNPKNTSIKCSKCKHIAKENRKSQSKFECVKCGFKANADYNASLNILAEGLSVIACGAKTLVSALKLEPEMRKLVFSIS